MTYSHCISHDINASDFPSHMHNGYEILLFVNGDADYMIEGSAYKLRKYDLLFIKPRRYHNLIPRSHKPYERFIINFADEDLSSLTRIIADSLPSIFNISEEPYVREFFDTWKKNEDIIDKNDLSFFVGSSVEPVILMLKYCRAAGQKERSGEPVLKNILEYIDKHLEDGYSISGLAEMFYVSPSRLSHMFTESIGISPMQYIERKKMLYAQELIQRGVPPTEVAECCHCGNYSTFFRKYVKIFGVSPRADRARGPYGPPSV